MVSLCRILRLLSTVSGSLLYCITDARTSSDVWTIINWMFVVVTAANFSRLCHELHSIWNRKLMMNENLSKIQNMCELIEAFRHYIYEAKPVEVILSGLSLDCDAVVTLASFSSKPLPM